MFYIYIFWILVEGAQREINNAKDYPGVNTLTGGISGGSSPFNRFNHIDIEDQSRTGPLFDKAASKNVTALLGKTAYLNCRVKNLGNKTVSLLRIKYF